MKKSKTLKHKHATFFRLLVVKTRYIYHALSEINKPYLGEIVRFGGYDCELIQGVSNPYWDLVAVNPKTENIIRWNRIHITEFRRNNTIKRFWGAFIFHYKFMVDYWLHIDLRNLKNKGVK